MAITVKKTPGWTPGQRFSLTGTGPGMVVRSSGGGGGGGGGTRPLVDANHIHVWNCDEAPGATVLVDSVGGKNLTLQGGEGTSYSLNQTVSGSPYPSVKSLLLANNSAIGINSNMNINAAVDISWECVFTPAALDNNTSVILAMKNNAGNNYAYIQLAGNSGSKKVYYGIKGTGGLDLYTNPNGGPTVATNTTHHIMGVYKFTGAGTTVDLYMDGAYIGGPILQNNGGSLTLDVMYICGWDGFSVSQSGYIRDVRVSNIARDATYAAAAYAALV